MSKICSVTLTLNRTFGLNSSPAGSYGYLYRNYDNINTMLYNALNTLTYFDVEVIRKELYANSLEPLKVVV